MSAMEPKAKPAQAVGPGPGATLRQAREQRGLGIDDVAQELRLSPRLIRALEEDAYDRLPGPTYVRGYLRNYAQFLGLVPERLIDAFNARPEAAQPTDLTAPAPVRQATSSDAAVRFGTVAVVAVVLALVVLWWNGQTETAPTPQPEATADEPPAGEVVPETTAAVPEPTVTPPNPETDVAPATPPVAASPAETRPDTARSDAPAAAAARVEPPPPVDPNLPMSRLVLYVHEDSWADVRDARQQRLLYETIPAGSVVTVQGVAPISVFLGNVAGVTVEFDGKPYDALRHRRGDIARFTLGAPRG